MGSNSACSLGTGEVIHATDKALLVELHDLGRELWVPISVLHDDSEIFDDDENGDGELVVLEWWAERNGLV